MNSKKSMKRLKIQSNIVDKLYKVTNLLTKPSKLGEFNDKDLCITKDEDARIIANFS